MNSILEKQDGYIINVKDNTYFGDRVYVDTLINIGKESMIGKHAIIAVEKDKTVMLLSQTHKTAKQLGKSMTEYISNGFKVYTA
ncbi:MAG: hypothetical protein WC998_05185 [Candidatus Paceibacterota bacterium]|jgi:hypothetical protein